MAIIKKEQIESCSTKEELVQLLNDHHIDGKEEIYSGDHVLIVFADGEICSTKAGDLFLKRGMHQLEGGVLKKADRIEGLSWECSDFGAVTLQNVAHGTLNDKIKMLFQSNEEEIINLEAGNVFEPDINSLKPITISGGWQLDDSPQIMKLYFWGSEKKWRPGKEHKSGRESKYVKYMTHDVNTALKIQLLGYGRIIKMNNHKEDPSYEFEAVELY